MGANDHRDGTDADSIRFGSRNCGLRSLTYVVSMAQNTRIESGALAAKYVAGTVIGALIFIAAPETARWLHGGAFAQDGMPKKGDMIGEFSVGVPKSGEMPKAGDMLGGIVAGVPNNGQPQTISPVSPSAANLANGSTSNYSIGEIHDNHGIIHQGPINLAPQPELHGIQADQMTNSDGTFTHRYLVEWTAEFPGDWRVLAYSKSILAVNISSSMVGWSGIRPEEGYAFTTVGRPNGRYTIIVQTRANDPIELKHELIR